MFKHFVGHIAGHIIDGCNNKSLQKVKVINIRRYKVMTRIEKFMKLGLTERNAKYFDTILRNIKCVHFSLSAHQ